MAALANIVGILPSVLLPILVVVVLLLVLLVGIAYALVIGKMAVISVSELRRPKRKEVVQVLGEMGDEKEMRQG